MQTIARALALLAVAAPPAHAAVPSAIELSAEGVQIYQCAPTADGAAWKLLGPEATLRDTDGRAAGRHFLGPSWQAPDGSTVRAAPLVASPAPAPPAIAWLVLEAIAHDGDGQFAHVTHITRTHTKDSLPPATGCDPAHLGSEVRSAYTAIYTLFSKP